MSANRAAFQTDKLFLAGYAVMIGQGKCRNIGVKYGIDTDRTTDALRQATEILNQIDLLRKSDANKDKIFYLTYSANEDQTKAIKDAHKSKTPWKTGIYGGGQALVVEKIEALLEGDKYKHLQSAFRILPITTIPTDETEYKKDKKKYFTSVKEGDIDYINQVNDNEKNCILIWGNQDAVTAIGGNIALSDPIAKDYSDLGYLKEPIAYLDNLYIAAQPDKKLVSVISPAKSSFAATTHITKEKIDALEKKLKLIDDKWEIEPDAAHRSAATKIYTAKKVDGSKINQFKIDCGQNKLSTTDSDIETFKVMLESFKVLNPDAKPQISAPDSLKEKWVEACKKSGYSEEEIKKIITMPESKSEPAASPRQGR